MRMLLPLLILSLLVACESDEDLPPGSSTPASVPGGPSAAGPDLSTPESAVRSFCAAVVASDERTAGACVAENPGERELVKLKTGEMTIDEGFRDGGRGMVVSNVTGTEYDSTGTEASVSVLFAGGPTETFLVVKTPTGWKISDF